MLYEVITHGAAVDDLADAAVFLMRHDNDEAVINIGVFGNVYIPGPAGVIAEPEPVTFARPGQVKQGLAGFDAELVADSYNFV